MQIPFFSYFGDFLNVGFLIFTITFIFLFLAMAGIFTKVSLDHAKTASLQGIGKVLDSSMSPSISIIAPAYNEESNIVENIKSLLSLHYEDYEIIVVNDGSKDGTLSKIVNAFNLELKHAPMEVYPCKRIKNVYVSRNSSLGRLVVIDKENGGKSDALNAGIHYSQSRIVGCIDADCVLHPNALSHIVRAFFEPASKKVIAVGGVIRVANSCKIKDGKLNKVRIPKSWLAKYQLLEYTRSFLLGRMSWGGIDGLLIISGAFGFFDRETLVRAGGYATDTVGEDMEIIFRMRRYMIDHKEPNTVRYLPEALCYTEVPENRAVLVNQRDRWARGNFETLKKHRAMFFNPKYGRLGLLSYPFWFFFEWLAPIIEFTGILAVLFFWYFDSINWEFLMALTLVIYGCFSFISLYSIAWDFYNYHQYDKKRDYFSLVLCAITEPILFHPLIVFASIRGNLKKLMRQKSIWGDNPRKGFSLS